ncbi:PEP-utilizing enzyme [Mesorhizobium sp. Cs1299R1N3]|uniref:PEP-utilizing enzyme n=1 Tax=Mesorhizobium sp. Cs1299R1N3 TaxID=3015173 RepID=UPI00301BF913
MTTFTENELLADKGYPGFSPELVSENVYFGAARQLSAEDLDRFWLLEYRWPNGFCPLGLTYVELCLTWANQYAAQHAPLPPADGYDNRIVGTSVYGTERPSASAFAFASRDIRLTQRMPGFIRGFDAFWNTEKEALLRSAQVIERTELEGRTLAGLDGYLTDCVHYMRWTWERHFEIMYLMLLNHAGFYRLCEQLGINKELAGQMFGGRKTKISEGDAAIWALTDAIREAGAEAHFAGGPLDAAATRAALASGTAAERALDGRIGAFLDEWGWRTEIIGDPLSAPWIEDATPLFGHLRNNLASGKSFDLDSRVAKAREDSEAAIEAVRARLSTPERAEFDKGLEANRAASFVWWNEDHNFYIDQRTAIPLRRAALAIGRALDLAEAEDTCFLFLPELRQLARGEKTWRDFGSLVRDRRDYYTHWKGQRVRMPKFIGTPPDRFVDPILTELDGMSEEFLARLGQSEAKTELKGVAASPGTARGRVRIVRNAEDLHQLEKDDVLVCEGTSPSWTAAFTRIAACLADQGGTLSHAAIVSREYRLPCIVALAKATTTFANGDEVIVDGDKGTVRRVQP